MLKNPSLVTRIAIGKFIGFIIGLAGFVLMPAFFPDASLLERTGILLWYTTMGAFVGLSGVFTWHPILKARLHWWLRSSLVGAWMNLALTLLMFPRLNEWMQQISLANGFFVSPFWFVVEGALVALIIEYCCLKGGGEGIQTCLEEQH